MYLNHFNATLTPVAASATDAVIHKKMFGYSTTTLDL